MGNARATMLGWWFKHESETDIDRTPVCTTLVSRCTDTLRTRASHHPKCWFKRRILAKKYGLQKLVPIGGLFASGDSCAPRITSIRWAIKNLVSYILNIEFTVMKPLCIRSHWAEKSQFWSSSRELRFLPLLQKSQLLLFPRSNVWWFSQGTFWGSHPWRPWVRRLWAH